MRCSSTFGIGPWTGAALTAGWCGLLLVASAAGQQFELNEQQFNHWIYQAGEAALDPEAELAVAVEAVDRACNLTGPQKEKLRLAARGDYARFEQRVGALRAKYVGKSFPQEELGEIHQEFQPLAATYQSGLLGDGSLFSKVLAGVLSPDQIEQRQADRAELLAARSAAKVRLFVAMLERGCPLTDEQRTAIVDLLVGETRAPARASQYDWYVVLWYASQIPEEKFAAILDDAQMQCLQQLLRQGAGMGHFLRRQGLLPEEQ